MALTFTPRMVSVVLRMCRNRIHHVVVLLVGILSQSVPITIPRTNNDGNIYTVHETSIGILVCSSRVWSLLYLGLERRPHIRALVYGIVLFLGDKSPNSRTVFKRLRENGEFGVNSR